MMADAGGSVSPDAGGGNDCPKTSVAQRKRGPVSRTPVDQAVAASYRRPASSQFTTSHHAFR